MSRVLLQASALAGVVVALGLAAAQAGERVSGGPAVDELRGGQHRRGGHAAASGYRSPPPMMPGSFGPRPIVRHGERRPSRGLGYGVSRADVAGLRLSHRLGARPYGRGAAANDRGGDAPLTVGYGGGDAPSYASSGYGHGSTGYGYGGDFSTAYTSGYDDFQTVGYGTRDGTDGGRGDDRGGGAAPFDGRGGYGYGGGAGWSPAIPPAGGLAVYSPGAYGPGPRIVTIPTHYPPGAPSFGCRCGGRD